MIDSELLKILACPKGKSPLSLKDDALVCACGLSFRIEDDIPILLLEEATLPEGVASLDDLDCAKKAEA